MFRDGKSSPTGDNEVDCVIVGGDAHIAPFTLRVHLIRHGYAVPPSPRGEGIEGVA